MANGGVQSMNDYRNWGEAVRHTALDPASVSGSVQPTARIDARTLLGDAREVILLLQGTEYRLRLTSKGKLILTK